MSILVSRRYTHQDTTDRTMQRINLNHAYFGNTVDLKTRKLVFAHTRNTLTIANVIRKYVYSYSRAKPTAQA